MQAENLVLFLSEVFTIRCKNAVLVHFQQVGMRSLVEWSRSKVRLWTKTRHVILKAFLGQKLDSNISKFLKLTGIFNRVE